MLAQYWGVTPTERAAPYPCEGLVDGPADTLLRAVDVAADAATVFRWVCQVKVAPYSYDWIDNRGRRSPRELTPGAADLAVGQRFAVVFRIAGFEPGRSITARTAPSGERLFGAVAMSYVVEPSGPGASRLIGAITLGSDGRLGRLRTSALAVGDLVMMRKQLLTLKALAES